MEIAEYNDSSFESLVDEFLDEYWRMHPHEATFMGIHEYDNELDRVDNTTLNQFVKREEEITSILSEFKNKGKLSADNLLDLEVLLSNLRNDIMAHEKFNRYRRDPSIYVNIAIFSCYILLLRNFAPKEQRYISLISRLKEVPRFLEEARANLREADSIPEVWLNIAKEMASSGQRFFSHTILEVSCEVEPLKNDVLAAARQASKALADYSEFLESELSKKPAGSFAAGREYFEFLLRDFHMLPYSGDEIEEIGSDYIERTTARIKQLAKEIDPGKEWIDVIENIKSDSPSPEELLDYYNTEVARTKQFVLYNDLVSLPEDESLDVMETPESHRATYPYAAYLMPGPFERTQRGFFWVTPIDGLASEEKKREQLAGHSKPAITVRTLHEGYPGHHLQFCHANRIGSKLRRVFTTPVFAEGWALYCEDLMREKGFYSDKKTEIIQLKDQLWRACRVVIDVRLHTGQLTFDEAVDMLVEKARLERYNAEAEVKRYSQTPTQPMSYLIGKIEIERLAADFRNRFPDVSLKEFHNKLLSYGTIPITLVRSSMLGTN